MGTIVVGPNVTIGQTVAGPSLPIGNGATYFVTGMTERGSTNSPIALTSMADYAKFCGNAVGYGYLYNDLTTFFAEGGQLAYVARVVGPSATAGSITLLDTNGSVTLRLTANSVGEWSGNLTVEVVNNGVSPPAGGLPNTFSIYLRGGDATASTVVESYLNMSSPSSAASLMAYSNYVTVTNLGSTSSPPANNPATLNQGGAGNGVALSTGNSNVGGVVTASYLTAASSIFTPDLGDGICAIPGQSATNIAAIVPLNAAQGRTTILSPPQGSTNTAVESICATLKSSAANPQNAGLFWPWVQAPTGLGQAQNIPPDGFVAGVRARNALAIGVWQAPFGVSFGSALYIVGTENDLSPVTPALVEEVYGVGINPIRVMGGIPVLYGWQSLSLNPNYEWINAMDLLDRLAFEISRLMEQYIAYPIDSRGILFTDMQLEIQSILDPIAQANGLYPLFDANGNQIDPGYTINISSSLNTIQNISEGIVTATVAVRMSPSAALINITVVKTGFTAAS